MIDVFCKWKLFEFVRIYYMLFSIFNLPSLPAVNVKGVVQVGNDFENVNHPNFNIHSQNIIIKKISVEVVSTYLGVF